MEEKKRILTAGGLRALEDELQELKGPGRKLIAQKIKEAREQGDLSENFEYYAAKKAKNQNESRIRYLENMLKFATIVEDDSKSGEVGMNNTVTLYFPEDDMEETYKIVTSIRSNSLKGKISIESPLGKALLGHKVGDTVTIEVDDSYSYDVEIRAIDESTDDAEDEIKSF